MISPDLQDPTTLIKGHTILTHLPCLLLRTGIALSIMSGYMSTKGAMLLSAAVVMFFGYKYLSLQRVWKVYLRTVFVYAIVFLLSYFYGDRFRSVSGTLIITDVLMAIQSRHIFEMLGSTI
jgi:hypothetical protein